MQLLYLLKFYTWCCSSSSTLKIFLHFCKHLNQQRIYLSVSVIVCVLVLVQVHIGDIWLSTTSFQSSFKQDKWLHQNQSIGTCECCLFMLNGIWEYVIVFLFIPDTKQDCNFILIFIFVLCYVGNVLFLL